VVLLPSGKVLIIGGDNSNNLSAVALSSAEIYDPVTGLSTSTGNMATARDLSTATVLPNGKVLIVGGYDSTTATLASAELYDPNTGTFAVTGSMSVPRQEHTATLLPNGKVLITGGAQWHPPAVFYASAEIYDPATGQFTLTGTMNSPHVDHTATLLPNGKVLVASGLGSINPDGSNAQITTSAELYDPSAGTFTLTGSMTTARFNHAATSLPNGRVLVTGGYFTVSGGDPATASAEIYDPVAGTFTATVNMNVARAEQASTLLPNGDVFIAGGFSSLGFFGGTQLSTSEIYKTGSGTFSGLSSMIFPHSRINAPLLANGEVLLASGTIAELYFPSSTGRYAYVPISNGNVVTVFDVSSDQPVATIPVGAAPFDAAVSPNHSFVYVDNSNSNSVSVIDPTTNTVVATIPVGSIPAGIAITPDSSTIYVATHGDNSVSVINAATKTVIATVAVGSYPFLLASTPDGKNVYVPNFQSASVSVISTATNSVIATIPVGLAPQAVAITPDSKFAYVTCTNSNLVYVLDTATNTVVNTIPVSNGPLAVSITPDGTTAYVSEYSGAATAVINLATNTVIASVPVGATPYGSAITPDGAFVWQTSWSATNISVISTANKAVVATIPVSGYDFNVAITPK
jgi:YVTN family beta-propeller protein